MNLREEKHITLTEKLKKLMPLTKHSYKSLNVKHLEKRKEIVTKTTYSYSYSNNSYMRY